MSQFTDNLRNAVSYCYQSVNVVSLSWSQSDHIKRRLLYLHFLLVIDLTNYGCTFTIELIIIEHVGLFTSMTMTMHF
jgi:hypothetical protein